MRSLLAFHEEVDREAALVAERHRGRLRCRNGCNGCCVDGLTVYEIEAERILRLAPEILREPPHAQGVCAFLDPRGACRIYDHRPYVCRTQGLPLRWLERRRGAAGLVELRSICPLNETGAPIESLPEEACWAIGPFEGKLAAIQIAWRGGKSRVTLRDLFTPPSARS